VQVLSSSSWPDNVHGALSVAEWQAIEAGWPQLRHLEGREFLTDAPLLGVPALCSRLEHYNTDAVHRFLPLEDLETIAPRLPNLREICMLRRREGP